MTNWPQTGVGACGWCSNNHTGQCPRVQEIEYHPNGTVKRVVLHKFVQGYDLRSPHDHRGQCCRGQCR